VYLTVCDMPGCTVAAKTEGGYNEELPTGWVRVTGWVPAANSEFEERPEMPPVKQVTGEVEIDGRTMPLRIFAPPEIEAYEQALRQQVQQSAFRSRPKRVAATCCPGCSFTSAKRLVEAAEEEQ
jgi:hypothetical protein